MKSVRYDFLSIELKTHLKAEREVAGCLWADDYSSISNYRLGQRLTFPFPFVDRQPDMPYLNVGLMVICSLWLIVVACHIFFKIQHSSTVILE